MRRAQRITDLLIAGLVVLSAAILPGCRRAPEPAASPQAAPTPVPMDLQREDMAALPGASVDLQTLEDFPYYLRQESRMTADEVFGYYDDFFTGKGWSVEVSVDPITEGRVHRYRLGDELAFVTVSPVDSGGIEVVLSRRTLRDDER